MNIIGLFAKAAGKIRKNDETDLYEPQNRFWDFVSGGDGAREARELNFVRKLQEQSTEAKMKAYRDQLNAQQTADQERAKWIGLIKNISDAGGQPIGQGQGAIDPNFFAGSKVMFEPNFATADKSRLESLLTNRQIGEEGSQRGMNIFNQNQDTAAAMAALNSLLAQDKLGWERSEGGSQVRNNLNMGQLVKSDADYANLRKNYANVQDAEAQAKIQMPWLNLLGGVLGTRKADLDERNFEENKKMTIIPYGAKLLQSIGGINKVIATNEREQKPDNSALLQSLLPGDKTRMPIPSNKDRLPLEGNALTPEEMQVLEDYLKRSKYSIPPRY